jgi:hypothetical protein
MTASRRRGILHPCLFGDDRGHEAAPATKETWWPKSHRRAEGSRFAKRPRGGLTRTNAAHSPGLEDKHGDGSATGPESVLIEPFRQFVAGQFGPRSSTVKCLVARSAHSLFAKGIPGPRYDCDNTAMHPLPLLAICAQISGIIALTPFFLAPITVTYSGATPPSLRAAAKQSRRKLSEPSSGLLRR